MFEELIFSGDSGNIMCFNVTIFDDLEFEGDENFILSIEDSNNASFTFNATVIIEDNEGVYITGA